MLHKRVKFSRTHKTCEECTVDWYIISCRSNEYQPNNDKLNVQKKNFKNCHSYKLGYLLYNIRSIK